MRLISGAFIRRKAALFVVIHAYVCSCSACNRSRPVSGPLDINLDITLKHESSGEARIVALPCKQTHSWHDGHITECNFGYRIK